VVIARVLLLGSPVSARQSVELRIGIIYRILAAFLGSGWRPIDVHIAHPPARGRTTYRAFSTAMSCSGLSSTRSSAESI